MLFATFTVTSTADEGPGSLRQAILDANSAPGADEIRFDIPGPGVKTIAPASPLPAANAPVTIDATTQPGYAGAPLIELNGQAAGAAADGLTLRNGISLTESAVRGLAVNGFGGDGIVLDASRVSVEACYVGITPGGDAARPNAGAGVAIHATFATIGGTTAAQRNVISGNGGPGVLVARLPGSSAPPWDTVVNGNYIGTDAGGGTAIGNGQEGVLVQGEYIGTVLFVRIGGTAAGAGNVISGNAASGVRLVHVNDSWVRGNLIGTDAAGSRAVPNGTSPAAAHRDGITVLAPGSNPRSYDIKIGGDAPEARNVISGNAGAGVAMDQTAAAVSGNYIGTDATGTIDLGNGGNGITVRGAAGAYGGLRGNPPLPRSSNILTFIGLRCIFPRANQRALDGRFCGATDPAVMLPPPPSWRVRKSLSSSSLVTAKNAEGVGATSFPATAATGFTASRRPYRRSTATTSAPTPPAPPPSAMTATGWTCLM